MPDQPRSSDPHSMRGDVERLLRQLRGLEPAAARPVSVTAPTVPTATARPRPQPRASSARAAIRPNSRPGPRPLARPSAVTLPSPHGVWARVVLGVALAGAATQWPHGYCGVPLGGYLAVSAMVAIAGAWVAHAAWRRRMGRAHVIAIALVLTGATLAALQVLPRPGHAPTEIAWRCPS